MERYGSKGAKMNEKLGAMSHNEAMETIIAAAKMSTLSYEEAVACYLRARGILNDNAEYLAGPMPVGWTPPRADDREWIADELHKLASVFETA
jgi:hypothetical protein